MPGRGRQRLLSRHQLGYPRTERPPAGPSHADISQTCRREPTRLDPQCGLRPAHPDHACRPARATACCSAPCCRRSQASCWRGDGGPASRASPFRGPTFLSPAPIPGRSTRDADCLDRPSAWISMHAGRILAPVWVSLNLGIGLLVEWAAIPLPRAHPRSLRRGPPSPSISPPDGHSRRPSGGHRRGSPRSHRVRRAGRPGRRRAAGADHRAARARRARRLRHQRRHAARTARAPGAAGHRRDPRPPPRQPAGRRPGHGRAARLHQLAPRPRLAGGPGQRDPRRRTGVGPHHRAGRTAHQRGVHQREPHRAAAPGQRAGRVHRRRAGQPAGGQRGDRHARVLRERLRDPDPRLRAIGLSRADRAVGRSRVQGGVHHPPGGRGARRGAGRPQPAGCHRGVGVEPGPRRHPAHPGQPAAWPWTCTAPNARSTRRAR